METDDLFPVVYPPNPTQRMRLQTQQATLTQMLFSFSFIETGSGCSKTQNVFHDHKVDYVLSDFYEMNANRY